jgi:hypothetical protein
MPKKKKQLQKVKLLKKSKRTRPIDSDKIAGDQELQIVNSGADKLRSYKDERQESCNTSHSN